MISLEEWIQKGCLFLEDNTADTKDLLSPMEITHGETTLILPGFGELKQRGYTIAMLQHFLTHLSSSSSIEESAKTLLENTCVNKMAIIDPIPFHVTFNTNTFSRTKTVLAPYKKEQQNLARPIAFTGNVRVERVDIQKHSLQPQDIVHLKYVGNVLINTIKKAENGDIERLDGILLEDSDGPQDIPTFPWVDANYGRMDDFFFYGADVKTSKEGDNRIRCCIEPELCNSDNSYVKIEKVGYFYKNKNHQYHFVAKL